MKLNNKGQVLVMFVLLIPIFLLVLVLVVDISNLYIKKDELNNINYLVIDSILDKGIDDLEIKNLILKNDKDIIINYVNINDEVIEISLEKEYNGIFSHLVRMDKYNIESNYKGYKKENKKIIERVK